MPLREAQDSQELVFEETDWTIFYTQAKSIKTKAIVEVIMIEEDILAGTHKQRGVGYAEVPLFYDDNLV
jgi:hypothetical protein